MLLLARMVWVGRSRGRTGGLGEGNGEEGPDTEVFGDGSWDGYGEASARALKSFEGRAP